MRHHVHTLGIVLIIMATLLFMARYFVVAILLSGMSSPSSSTYKSLFSEVGIGLLLVAALFVMVGIACVTTKVGDKPNRATPNPDGDSLLKQAYDLKAKKNHPA